MKRISQNIRIILRTERLIWKRQTAVAGRKAGLLGAAAVLGAVALVFLNLAAYFALSSRMDPALAALLLALGDILLAGLLLVLAKGQSADREVAAVSELRDMAIADLEADLEAAGSEAREMLQNVRTMASDPFSRAGLSVLAPLLSLLVKNLPLRSAEKDKITEKEE